MAEPISKTHAVAVGVVLHHDQVLLLRRSPTQRHSPGLWEFFGGFIREKEAAEDTVLREVKEDSLIGI